MFAFTVNLELRNEPPSCVVLRGQTFARGGGACGEEEPVVRLDTVAGFLLATLESWRDQSRCRTAIMGVA